MSTILMSGKIVADKLKNTALNDTTSSTSKTEAATANAVKTAYDAAVSAQATANSKASTAVATTSANGLMSSSDKQKLDGLISGGNVPTNHASSAETYGKSTANYFGHAKASSATPLMNGSANPGTDNGMYAREGHVHPSDSSKLSLSGGTLTGNLTIQTGGNYGGKLNFGDGDYVHLYEDADDQLNIKATKIKFNTAGTLAAYAQSGKLYNASGVEYFAGTPTAIDSTKLPLTGGTVTGKLIVNNNLVAGTQKSGTTMGTYATIEGYECTASGAYSHSEGQAAQAIGQGSHAEGNATQATGQGSHAEGYATYTSKEYAHAEGANTKANGASSHAEGAGSTAGGNYSHAEGQQSEALGANSHSEGNTCRATADDAHAQNHLTVASGWASHAEGVSTQAKSAASHAEGRDTEASGNYSHAQGWGSIATGEASHAGGRQAISNGYATFSYGDNVIANQRQFVIGHYNVDSTSNGGIGSYNSPAFIIGSGTGPGTSRTNAFRIQYTGATFAQGAYSSTGADYAEFFEWADGNPDNEERIGLFVTLDGNKIKTASSPEDYIAGVTSSNPSVVGNTYDDQWSGMYLRDEWDRPVYEEVELEREVELVEEGGELIEREILPARTELRQKLNPAFDPDAEYIPRSQRPEWSLVGMLGQLYVRDDGTCEVNGYCAPSQNGVATRSDKGYRVVGRKSDNVVKIIIK